MNLIPYFTGLVSGVLFSSGVFSLLLSLKKIETKLNISYALFAFAILGSLLISPLYVSDNSIDSIILFEKINKIFLLIAAISFMFFVEAFSGYKSKIFRNIILFEIILLFILNLINKYGFIWEEIKGLSYSEVNSISVNSLIGSISNYIYLGYALFLSLLLFFTAASYYLSKSGQIKKSILLIICVTFGLIILTVDLIMLQNKIPRSFYIDQLSYLVFAILVTSKNFENVFIAGKIKSQLTNREEQFKLIAEHSKDMIALHNINGKILYISPSCKKVTGYTPDEVINLPAESLYHPDELPKLREMVNERSDRNWIFRVRRKDGKYIWIEASSSILYENGKPVKYIGVSRDITEYIKHEKELEFAKHKAEESDKLKSDFLAQISHEIRSPMNMILSFVSLFKEEINDNVSEDLQEGFTIIDSAGRRITRTINLIVDMSQIKSNTFECHYKDYDIEKVIIQKIFMEFRESAKSKGLKLNIYKNAENSIKNIDEYSVIHLFQNLVDNAIKYTDEGNVDIILYNDTDSNLVVKIKDTGIGISEEYLPKLFEPFMQEEQGYTRSYDGNGLGLALVKEYCNFNNIDIKVNSTKNVGTEFILTFR